MFMAGTSYIKNPYLRAKMVEVLNCWMPQRRSIFFYELHNCILFLTVWLRIWKFLWCHWCSGLSSTASLFEGHQLCLDYLVKNLLKLYVDIEFTGSHTQVSVKIFFFNISLFWVLVKSSKFSVMTYLCILYSSLTSLTFDIILLSF